MAAESPHAAPGTRKLSQNEQILALLSDGREHSFHEILRHVPCVVHSRISELRSRGHSITCERRDGDYLYTLGSPLAAGSDTLAHSGAGGLGPAASGDAVPTPVLGGVAARSPLSEPEAEQPSWGRPASSATSERVSGSLSGVASSLGGTDGSGAAQLSLLGEPSRRELWS